MENTSSTGIRKAPSTARSGVGDVAVQRVGQLQDGAFAEFTLVAFHGQLGAAVDDGGGVAGEFVLVQQFADFHLHQLEQFGVVHHVALVQVDDDVGHAHLAGQQDVFAGLGHGAVGGRCTPGWRRPSGPRP
jgi:hypothetical protein